MPGTITFADKPTLTGDRVLLRPLDEADIPSIMDGLADTESMRLTGTHQTFTTEAVTAAVRRWVTSDERIDLAVIERATNRYAGEVVLNDLDQDNLSCGFRISLTAGFTDRGLGSDATGLVLRHAFDTVGVHRVELDVYAFNPRARRVYEKVGFVYEGTRRHALRWQGEWVDCHIMAILADDWAARRAGALTTAPA